MTGAPTADQMTVFLLRHSLCNTFLTVLLADLGNSPGMALAAQEVGGSQYPGQVTDRVVIRMTEHPILPYRFTFTHYKVIGSLGDCFQEKLQNSMCFQLPERYIELPGSFFKSVNRL